MFETAELGVELDKAAYKKAAKTLRVELIDRQHRLAASSHSLVVVIGGVEGAGKSETANLLLSWLDARGVQTHALGEPTDEERERPRFWRYWRLLPAARRMALFLGSWYTEPIVRRAFKDMSQAELDQELDRIVEFERMLVREGVILVKLWLHISKKEQKQRLKALEKDPDTRWRVTGTDWKFHRRYDKFRKVCEHSLIKSSTAEAPWTVIDAHDRRHRDVSSVKAIIGAR